MANDILSRHPASPLWLAVARNGSYTPAVRRGIAGPRPMWMASLSGFDQGGSLINKLASAYVVTHQSKLPAAARHALDAPHPLAPATVAAALPHPPAPRHAEIADAAHAALELRAGCRTTPLVRDSAPKQPTPKSGRVDGPKSGSSSPTSHGNVEASIVNGAPGAARRA